MFVNLCILRIIFLILLLNNNNLFQEDIATPYESAKSIINNGEIADMEKSLKVNIVLCLLISSECSLFTVTRMVIS